MRAVVASSFLPYSSIDVGSGRCRMSVNKINSIFPHSTIGCVVKIELELENKLAVMCTLWPDFEGFLNEDIITVDDTVVIPADSTITKGNDIVFPPWTDASCKISIMNNNSSLSLSSLSVSWLAKGSTTNGSAPPISALLGLPLTSGCYIKTKSIATPPKLHNKSALQIIRTTPSTKDRPGVVTNHTIIKASSRALTDNRSELENSGVESNTSVVEELYQRVVLPTILELPPSAHLSGLLLTGQPGVGKTFALKSLQKRCAAYCDVHIMEVNVTDLLAEENPLKMLQETIAAAESMERFPEAAAAPSGNATPNEKVTTSPMAKTPSNAATDTRSPISSFVTPPVKKGFSFRNPGSSNSNYSTKSEDTPGLASRTSQSPQSFTSRTKPDLVTDFQKLKPAVVFLFIDEIDALGQGAQQTESQVAVAQYLCSWMDSRSRKLLLGATGDCNANEISETLTSNIKSPCKGQSDGRIYSDRRFFVPCCVLGTTNRVCDVDPYLLRSGRLDVELEVTNSQKDRQILIMKFLKATSMFDKIIQSLSAADHAAASNTDKSMCNIIENVAENMAHRTGGYVAADLANLVRKIDILSENHVSLVSGNADSYILQLFEQAAAMVQPSCLRGISVKLPTLSFDDVIGYTEIKKSLQRVLSLVLPQKQRKIRQFYKPACKNAPTESGGILLYGPPGNSKTRLITAAATSFQLPMISLSTADIYSPYVGDAEAEIRKAFHLARQAAPCVLFLDELDSIVTNRDSGGSSTASVESRVLATLLTEMDGINSCNTNDGDTASVGSSSGGVLVMAATNRVDFIDAALLRKGRFHHVINVPPPSMDEKKQLLHYFAQKYGIIRSDNSTLEVTDVEDSDLREIEGQMRDGMSGADVENLCREHAFRRLRKSQLQ